jgi:hypothetical protein
MGNLMGVYRLVKHAGHYGDATKKNGGGHDLDEWDITAPTMPTKHELQFKDAKFHHGYRDAGGAQHWVFSRLAPFSPERCDRCPAERT